MKRKRMNYKKSRADFSRKATPNKKNNASSSYVMRGGIRL